MSKEKPSQLVKVAGQLENQLHKTSIWIEKSPKLVSMMFLGLIGVLVVGAALFYWMSLQDKKIFTEAYSIESEVSKSLSELANNKDLKPEDKIAKEKELGAKVLSFIEKHPSHKSSRNLGLVWSKKLVDDKKLEEAIRFNQALKVSGSEELGALALYQRGLLLLNLKKAVEAEELFSKILNNEKWAYAHPRSSLSWGHTLVAQNKLDKAMQRFQYTFETFDQSPEAQEAQQMYRWVQLQKKK